MFARGRGPGIDFRVGRTPVRVEWSFLVVVAAAGAVIGRGGWAIATWVAVVVVGVLVHEGGHVAALATFARRSRVRLAWLSGMTIAEDDAPLSPGRSVVVSLAGPAAGVALGLSLEGLLAGHDSGLLGALREQSLVVNLVWSAFNLLPVMPLDGGHVARELVEWGGRTAAGIATIGVTLTAALIAGSVMVSDDHGAGWWVIVITLLAATNIAFLPLTPTRRQRLDIETVHRRMLRGELRGSIPLLQAHLLSPRADLVGVGPRTTLAWALLFEGRFEDLARVDLFKVHPAHQPYLAAAVAWYRGDVMRATDLVIAALVTGPVDPPPTFFTRAFGRLGEIDRLRGLIESLPRHQADIARPRLAAALAAAAEADAAATAALARALPV